MTKDETSGIEVNLRQQFSLLVEHHPQLVYFDSAATTQKPDEVVAATQEFYLQHNVNVHRGAYPLANATTAKFESVRQQVKRFINARTKREIVFTKGVTEGINLLAHGLGLCHCKAGQEIVLSALEHHGNIVPWQQLAQRLQLKIKVIPISTNGVLDITDLDQLVTENTAIVAVGHVSNAFGNINPIANIISRAKAVGALSVIDGAQAVGHIQVDVQQLDCDFYVFSGHKMFGPTGIGILYGKYQQLNRLPPYQTGGEMIQNVSFDNTTFLEAPLKFEAGTPNIQGVLGLGAAISWMRRYFNHKCMHAELLLYQFLLSELQAMPDVVLYGDLQHSVPILSMTFTGHNVQDIAELLYQQQIAVRVGHHCAMPAMQALGIEGTLRVSLSVYNTHSEVQRFICALNQALVLTQQASYSELSDEPIAALSTMALSIKQAQGWDQKYRQIMLAGKHLKRLECHSAQQKVNGCESPVWLATAKIEDKWHFEADSTSKIVRGLLAIILDAVEAKNAVFILQFQLDDYLKEIGLAGHLSQSRSSGLNAVWNTIQQAVMK